MEATWVGMRAHLRRELTLHPDWTYQQLADAVGCSKSMVDVWKRRFVHADPSDVTVLFSRPRRPRQAPSSFPPQVRERIIELRLSPPDGLGRIPGPRTLLSFLHRDPTLQGQRLPARPEPSGASCARKTCSGMHFTAFLPISLPASAMTRNVMSIIVTMLPLHCVSLVLFSFEMGASGRSRTRPVPPP